MSSFLLGSAVRNIKKLAKTNKEDKEEEKKPAEVRPAPTPSQNKTEAVYTPVNSISTAAENKITQLYEDKLLSASSTQSEVQKKIDGYIDGLTQKYDAFLDMLTGDSYKDSDHYKSIVSSYEDIGKRMSYGASASSASDNAGNIDSLGAANAHRQMLSYKNAGESAAREAYSEDLDRYAKGLGNYASDLTEGYSLLSQSSEREDNYNLSLLEEYERYQQMKNDNERADRELAEKRAQRESDREMSERELEEQIAKRKASEEAKKREFADLSDDLDSNNITNRYISYAKMLAQIYPDYAQEIQNIFIKR